MNNRDARMKKSAVSLLNILLSSEETLSYRQRRSGMASKTCNTPEPARNMVKTLEQVERKRPFESDDQTAAKMN
jgi:hypothetical protein